MRAARAARLFFLTRPIKILICGVVVAVAVVDAKAPYCQIQIKKSNASAKSMLHRILVEDLISSYNEIQFKKLIEA